MKPMDAMEVFLTAFTFSINGRTKETPVGKVREYCPSLCQISIYADPQIVSIKSLFSIAQIVSIKSLFFNCTFSFYLSTTQVSPTGTETIPRVFGVDKCNAEEEVQNSQGFCSN